MHALVSVQMLVLEGGCSPTDEKSAPSLLVFDSGQISVQSGEQVTVVAGKTTKASRGYATAGGGGKRSAIL